MNNANRTIKDKESSVVTLDMAKQQLNVDEDFKGDDEYILRLIEAATASAEDYTGIDIVLTTNTLVFNDFVGDSIKIFESPLNSVTSITYVVDGTESEVPIEDIKILNRLTDFTITLPNQIEADTLTVVFDTGYDMDKAPHSLIAAILIKINDLYDIERTSYVVGTNFRETKAFERLLAGHVINRW